MKKASNNGNTSMAHKLRIQFTKWIANEISCKPAYYRVYCLSDQLWEFEPVHRDWSLCRRMTDQCASCTDLEPRCEIWLQDCRSCKCLLKWNIGGLGCYHESIVWFSRWLVTSPYPLLRPRIYLWVFSQPWWLILEAFLSNMSLS